MSDMTVVQLVTAQRGKELRTEERLGILDCITIPVFAVVLGCLIVWTVVAGMVTWTLALLWSVDKQRKG